MSININRVYTRGGDQGETSLIGGQRVPKDHPRVAAYGSMDELNSLIGVARAALARRGDAIGGELDQLLKGVQSELFDLGNELGTPPGSEWEGMPRATPEAIAGLEAAIDRYNEQLEPLKSFILPAGGEASAALHVARTFCRRVERELISALRGEDLTASKEALGYVNRLSDLLFVVARAASAGTEDLWEGGFGRS